MGKNLNKRVHSQIKKPDFTNVTNTRPKRFTTTKVVDDGLSRRSQDVGKWRQAVINAESNINPNRTEYYRLLKDVTLDSHLSAIIDQRKNSVLCREVCFKKPDGTEDEEKTDLFKKEWFEKLLGYALDAKYYGFTLVDFGQVIDYNFPDITTVKRQYVKPELGIVVPNTAAINGIAIDDPKYSKWNLFIGETHDLGLLMKAAPWALWKKTISAYWSEYCEKFGMPLRVGKTNVHDEELKANMDEALRTMGAAFYATLNIDDEIQILETFNTAAYDIYDKFIERANSEMSKLILTQTGTTDEKSFVGSANVHEDQLSKLIESDVKALKYFLNEKLKPFLNNLGFGLDGYFDFEYEQRVSMEEKAKTAASFMPYVTFDKDWLEETFDIKIESMKDQSGGTDPKKPLTNYQNITNSIKYKKVIQEYKNKCKVCELENIQEDVLDLYTKEEFDTFYKGIKSGNYTAENLPVWIYNKTLDAIMFAVAIEWGYKSFNDALNSEYRDVFESFKINISAFAGAKVFNLVNDVTIESKNKSSVYDTFMLYNKTFLITEAYNAGLTSKSANNWITKIEPNKLVYNTLEYVTQKDEKVRESHKVLDGIIKDVNSDFWNVYYPPNGWGCRCSVKKLKNGVLSDTSKMNNPDDILDYFLFNSGKDKIIFSESHPYFDIPNKYKDLALKNFNLPIPNGKK